MSPAEHVTVFVIRLLAAACLSAGGSGWALSLNYQALGIEEGFWPDRVED